MYELSSICPICGETFLFHNKGETTHTAAGDLLYTDDEHMFRCSGEQVYAVHKYRKIEVIFPKPNLQALVADWERYPT